MHHWFVIIYAEKYLSICCNPLFIHNISLPNQYTAANSDFPAKGLSVAMMSL